MWKALSGILIVSGIAAASSAEPVQKGAATDVLGSGKPCMIASTSTSGTTPLAAVKPARSPATPPPPMPEVTGSKKPYKLVNTDPGLPSTARPDGGDTLNDIIDQQNADNPAHHTMPQGGAPGPAGSSGTSSSGSGSPSSGRCR